MLSSNIFYNNQYGFRQKHSTTHAITKLITDTVQAIDDKESVLSVFLDLSKAFDTIDHTILLSKLEFYGIRGIALDWFRDYLRERKQYVSYNGKQSQTLNITCGVPQGSVLGPLLFIIYTNDLPDCINRANTILFADDTTIYTSSSDIQYMYNVMNENLERLTDWFRANKLSLNITKTNYMLFSNASHIKKTQDLQISGQTIYQVKNTKFLGINIDDKLKWDVHIKSIKSRISSSLFIMNKIKHFVPMKSLRTLYYSIVYPYLTYGITLWGSTFESQLKKIKVMQKKVVRTIYGAPYNAHTEPIFKQLKIVKFEDLYKLQVAKFTYHFMRRELPTPLMNIYSRREELDQYRNTRRNTIYTLQTKIFRTIIASHNITHTGPKIWNKICTKIYLQKDQNFISTVCFIARLKRMVLGGYSS
jgi:hypothetical protein